MSKILERLFFRLTEAFPEFDGLPEVWLEKINDLAPEEIKRGLDNMDRSGYCPTPAEFRDLCQAKAKDAVKVLKEAPGLPTGGFSGPVNGKAWAYRLKKRHECGEKLSPIQIDYYRHVTGKGENNGN